MCALPVQGFAGNVNTADIIDGAVTTPKIADGAVTDAKITGPISGSKLATGSVNSNAIADGAITDAKITGPISGTKLAAGSVNTNTIANGAVTDEKISGIIGPEKLGAYSQVITVHKGVANNLTSFNSIQAAMNYLLQNTSNYSGDRQAILVMPGRYDEDLGVLNSTDTFNVDIIGASRTGSIVVPVNYNGYGSYFSMKVPSGLYLKNLTFRGFLHADHSKGAGIIGVDIVALSPAEASAYGGVVNHAGIGGGWQTINNFIIDDVYIEPAAGDAAIALSSTGDNDTLRFNNIRIKGGYLVFGRPLTSKPYTFSNITFSGGTPDQALFYITASNLDTPDPTFNFNNITTDGSYGYGFYSDYSSALKINVMNSKIAILNGLINGSNASNNVLSVLNSDISIASNNQGSDPIGNINIGNSRIGTIIPNSNSIRTVNCFDGNFEPIANGLH